MELELVSFKLCPYVQRSVITLKHKGVAHDVTYIDLDDKPPWFEQKSPLGLVPILIVDGETVLFESAVINEFVDEVTEGSMHPEDPVQRARDRAWIEFGSATLQHFYQMVMSPDKAGFDEHRDALEKKLKTLEALAMHAAPFFNGKEPALIDAAWAPLFMRLSHLDGLDLDWSGMPKVAAWKDALLDWDAVKGSVVPDFRELESEYLRAKGGHLARVLL